MVVNHTKIKEFDLFNEKYRHIICSRYPHITKYKIHCYEYEDYRFLDKVPYIDFSEIDTFGFAYDDTNLNNDIVATIIISPRMCINLKLTSLEIMAAIVHELGHIIYLSSDIVRNSSGCWQEIYADSVALKIGLSESLISLIKKLKSSKLYSEEQDTCFDWRIKMLEGVGVNAHLTPKMVDEKRENNNTIL